MRLTWIAMALATACAAFGQWNHRDDSAPRSRDGKVNLDAPAPKLGGKPDLSGVWQAARVLSDFVRQPGDDPLRLQVDQLDISKHFANVFFGMPKADEPLTPEGAALAAKRRDPHEAPGLNCLPPGVPGAMLIYAFKLIQTPKEIVVLPETANPPRQIYLDGRPLPKDPDPTWNGYSTGDWTGATLRVRTTGFNERSWIDGSAHPRSESMVVTERYTRRNFGHMDWEITFDDPKYYTRSFTVKTEVNLIPDTDVIEFVCTENERDRAHIR